MTLNPQGFNEFKMCRFGPMIFNKNDWPIGASLRAYGEYQCNELSLLEQLIKPGDIVVDAGANIGTHTVRMSQLVKDGCVLSFEPQRIAFQTLCANVALNSCLNVHAFHSALGDRCGFIDVPFRDQYKPNNFGGVPLAGTTGGEQTPIATLDSYGLLSCALIKADVEGMEAELLRGAAQTIAKYRPFLYLEADGAQSEEAMKMLLDMGYDCYWSLPPLYNASNFLDKAEDIFMTQEKTTIVSINILCVPKERSVEIIGLDPVQSPDAKPNMTITMEMRRDH